MPFGTPGHDAQGQVMQAFLNLVHFGMSLQESVTAPRIISLDFPGSIVKKDYNTAVVSAGADPRRDAYVMGR